MEGVKSMLLNSGDELFNYAVRLTGDYCTAWDLYQESCVRILTNKQQYSEQGKFLAWATTVMKRVFLNSQSSLRRRAMHFVDGFSLPCGELAFAVHAESVESFYITNEMLGMIEMLPPNQCRAFSLFIDGHSYADIAERMRVPVSSVRNFIHSARVTLRRVIER